MDLQKIINNQVPEDQKCKKYPFKNVRCLEKLFRIDLFLIMQNSGIDYWLAHHICFRKTVKHRRYLDRPAQKAYDNFIRISGRGIGLPKTYSA